MASVHGMSLGRAGGIIGIPGIETIPANSSWIAAFEYDQSQMRLTTHLKSGAIYQHAFVLPAEWEALKTAPSHSKQWADAIKGKKIGVRIKSAKSPTASLQHKRGRNV